MSSQANPFFLTRWFKASPKRLYLACTEAEDLGRWMGPKGSKLGVVRLEPEPGGMFLYSMTMPNGMVMWGRWIYRELVPGERIVVEQSFSDAKGGITVHPLSATWPLETLSTTTFVPSEDGTLLTLHWLPLRATEAQIATFDAAHEGMRMGFGGTFDQLEALVAEHGAKT